MRTLTGPLAAALLLFTSISFAAPTDETYTLQIHRPRRAQDTYDVHNTILRVASGTSASAYHPELSSLNGRMFGDLTGRVQVDQVDKQGQEVAVTLTIHHFLRSNGKDMIKPGTIIHILRKADSVEFNGDKGAQVPDEARILLEYIYPHLNPSQVTQDQALGSTKPVKPGDSWEFNKEVAAKWLAGEGLTVKPKDLKGKVTFNGPDTSGAAKGIRVSTTLSADNVTLENPFKKLIIEFAEMQFKLSTLLSTDPVALPLVTERVLEHTMHVSSTTGTFKVEIKTQIVHKRVITPVAKVSAAGNPG